MALHISLGECILHAAIIATPFVVLLVLGLYHLAPSGVFSVSAGTLERSPYINRILPQERAPESDEGGFVTLVADPAYFSVNLPDDDFTSVDVTLEYANRGQDILELGALTDIYAQSYDLAPVENRIIDESAWGRLASDGLVLLQRADEYASIDDFLADPPARSRIATYHADLDAPYRDPDYAPLGGTQTFDVSLRGYHKIVTYIKDEALSFTFAFMDMNRTYGPDEGVIRVWNEDGEVVAEERFSDDGNSTENQVSRPLTTVAVRGEGFDEGVYTIELSGTSDIFWRSIATTQRYATFMNRIYIGDDVGYLAAPRGTTFFTDAKHFTFETFHADSPQEVRIGRLTVPLPASHEKIQQSILDTGVISGSVPVGDIKITGEGLFAFAQSAFFNPYPARLTVHTDLAALGIDFILAEYAAPEAVDARWRRA
ncbi:hypothetical protein HYS28_03260, partial [Candidatus Uhrbacteria bacterium]|nr:hypothetical protein [Candidatus Uhrbacteria bacterium]